MTGKEKCLEKMSYVRSAFVFSLGAYALATKSPTKEYLSQYKVKLSDDKILVLNEADLLEQSEQSWLSYEIAFNGALDDGSARLFINQNFLYMILETFEAAKKYAESENLWGDFKNQDFYSFSRHLRNAIGHNGVWTINSSVKDLPTTFRNKTIDLSLNGKSIDGFIDWVYGLQLCAAISVWVSNS